MNITYFGIFNQFIEVFMGYICVYACMFIHVFLLLAIGKCVDKVHHLLQDLS